MSKQGNHNDVSVFESIVESLYVVYQQRDTNVNVTRGNWLASRLDQDAPNDPPIVAFLRMSGALQKTDQPGPHRFTTTDGSESEIWFNAHYEDVAIVECRITASDRCETERLWNDVIHTVRKALGQMSIPTSYEWPTQTEDGAAHIHAGQEQVIQLFNWRILVPHDSGTINQVKCIDTEVELQSGDGESTTIEKTITQVL